MLPEVEWYYYFPKFTLQTNHLNQDLLMKIPATDSRLRPDQRALEIGNFDLATTEKLRLSLFIIDWRRSRGPKED